MPLAAIKLKKGGYSSRPTSERLPAPVPASTSTTSPRTRLKPLMWKALTAAKTNDLTADVAAPPAGLLKSFPPIGQPQTIPTRSNLTKRIIARYANNAIKDLR